MIYNNFSILHTSFLTNFICHYFRATLEDLDFLVSRVKEVMKVPEEKLESQVQQDQLE